MKRNLVGKILGKIKIFVQDFVPIRNALNGRIFNIAGQLPEGLIYAAEGREILQMTRLLDRTDDTVLLIANDSDRDTFDTLWASGDAQIHTRRFNYSCKAASL